MARHTGPKNKLSRKVGEDLGLKTNALKVARRLNIPPGQHGMRGRRKVSDFGVQLKEKQKLKFVYGVLEKQLRRLYQEASRTRAATGAALLGLLERRLDNVVYRLGWASTRPAARQLVSHNHVSVNNRKINVPSHLVTVGDVIALKAKSANIPTVADQLQELPTAPAWLEAKGPAGKVIRLPERDDITERIDEQLIIEFYSR
ncbi:MAG: 30S ribosomal protein S4 [Candidatus Pacebacteria bacterium CG10_big_fil_rev_8_21_14_0_10_56_10]|nr:MAG: 30S ribosomal protein S4 [Candidatus Pacebacteria bacterium CG10_big_fil_rev_8_21_14_0_10_56_10]